MYTTTTTNRLHFEDLDAKRFEDLVVALLYPECEWAEFQPYGRSGSDGGVDIYALQDTDRGRQKEWRVQCRRIRRAGKAKLEEAVDDCLRDNKNPAVLLVVVACDVSRGAHESYLAYARRRGVRDARLWTASFLEAKLAPCRGRSTHHRNTPLFCYFICLGLVG